MLGQEKTFSFQLSAAEQVGGGFKSVPSDIDKLVLANGFTNMGSTVRAATSEHVLYFGSKTVNNLPLLFEVACQGAAGSTITITYKVPVPPLKDLLEHALRVIFTKK
jgi:hypothetical protein